VKLEGRVALITGAGRNIGRATAIEMAREGADIVVNVRQNIAEAEAVAEEVRALGRTALVAAADVSDKSQVDAMFAQALARFGRVDILVTNAAIRPQKPFLELTVADWRAVTGMILDGTFYCAQAALPSMVANRFGRLIFFGGDGSLTGSPLGAPISAAKMGVIGLARSLARAFAPYNITVNVVSPGRIDTQRNLDWYLDRSEVMGTTEVPLGRYGRPEEIARACVYLAADAAYMTGQVLHLSGGERVWL
jgi:NAD(P)-dependent dehydrogenase (short-subunit alcohol dehydrogenase family)